MAPTGNDAWDETIELQGGVRVPLEAVRLAIELELAGCRWSVTPEGRLIVSNGQLLTPRQQEQIRRLKPHLIRIVTYRVPDAVAEFR